MFQFEHNEGTEAYEKLFFPHLIKPINEHVQSDRCILTENDEWELPENVYTTDEDNESIRGLSEFNLCLKGMEAELLNGKQGSKLLSSKSAMYLPNNLFKKINRFDLLSDKDRLQEYASKANSHEFFRGIYSWLSKYPFYETYFYYRTRKRQLQYHKYEILLTNSGKIQKGGETYYIDQSLYQELDSDSLRTIESRYSLIDWGILAGQSPELISNILSFLRGFTGLQIVDIKKAYKDLALPKILTGNELTGQVEDLVNLTTSISAVLGNEIESGTTIWVTCKDGRLRHSDEVVFSKDYNLSPGWENNSQYLPDLNYLEPAYLTSCKDDNARDNLIRFMKECGVREDPKGGVEEFAVNVVRNWLENNKEQLNILNIQDVHGRDYGYDIDVTKGRGQPIKIEVKGLSTDMDITLTGHESEAADKYKDNYYVAVVNSIPQSPAIHFLKNPSYRGHKETILVPSTLWKMQSDSIHL